jgi:hypothetical protein
MRMGLKNSWVIRLTGLRVMLESESLSEIDHNRHHEKAYFKLPVLIRFKL